MAPVLDLNLNPATRELRQFGFIALVVFGVLAGCAWSECGFFAFGLGAARAPLSLGLAALSITAGLASLIKPAANRPLYLGLNLLAYPIGWLLSHLLLAALFFGLIAPLAMLLRLLGRDPLRRTEASKTTESYWLSYGPRRDKDQYFRQF